MSSVYDKVLRLGLYGLMTEAGAPAGGDVFYVDGNSGNAANTASSGQGDSWDLPFSTVNYAISRCSNNAGNVILVAADHAETIADTNDDNVSGTVTDEFCVDKTGITIVGLGENTRRPTFTLATATDARIDVRAANCTLCNLIFYNNVADNVAMLDAQAGADGLTIENCKFWESGTGAESILQVLITAACNDVTIRGCRFYNVDTNDGGLASIKLEGASDRIRIIDNVFDGDWNEQMIDADTAASTEVEVRGNVMNNVDTGVACVLDFHDSTTGMVVDNIVHCPAGGSGGGAIIAVGCLLSNNKVAVNEGQEAVTDPGSVGGTGIENRWYVDAGVGAATGTGQSWADALTTIDAAIALCTENNGDVIHVAAGHTENVASGKITCDKAGITILGHGYGESKPFVTFITATTACVIVTSDNVKIENIKFGSNFASIAHMIDVDGDDCHIINCEFVENGQTALSCITADTTGGSGHGDGLKIIGCRFYQPTDENLDNCIDIGCDITDVQIKNNWFLAAPDDAVIEFPAGGNACQEVQIMDNMITCEKTGIHCIEVDVAALTVTGICARNILVCDTRSAALQPNILSCYGNVWIPLGGNLKPVALEADGVTPGDHIYVDSALGVDDTAHGTTWNEPVATVDYAVGLCANNNGDTIHVAPGHAETLATPSAITLDIIGITIKGYGIGTDRPTITLDTGTDTTIVQSAANVTIENIIFINTQDALVVAFDVNAAHFVLKDCVFRDAGADNTIEWFICDANADYFELHGCVNEGTDTAGNTAWVTLNGNSYVTIKDCKSNGDFSAANIQIVTAACPDIHIDNCRLENNNAVDVNIEGFAATTGWIANTYCWNTTDTQTTWINTPGALGLFECYGVNNDGEAGLLIGTPSA